MKNYQELITNYVKGLDPVIWGADRVESIKVTPLPPGNWNFNYLVTINDRKFVFKLYSPNVQGLLFENSGRNEFLILDLIKDLEISPKPVHFDESGTFFNYSVLIYEYVKGQRLQFSGEAVQEIAKIFAKIHTMDTAKAGFVEEKDHHPEFLMQEIINSFDRYRQRDDAQQEEIELFSWFIEKAKEHFLKANITSNSLYPKTIIHTDPVPSNFVVGDKIDKITLIDWQRPIIADPAFDVWAFLSEPFNLWDLPETISEEQKELFLTTYLGLREDSTLLERIKLKEPLYLLQLGLYCLLRHSDYKNGKILEELWKGREENFERYGKTKEVIIEKLKEILKPEEFQPPF